MSKPSAIPDRSTPEAVLLPGTCGHTREDESCFREICDLAADGVVLIDRAWCFSYANPRALEITGTEDVIGANIFELFPGNRIEPYWTSYQRAMDEREPGEFEAFHPDPLNLWLRVRVRPHAAGIVVFFSDVTERRAAETREQRSAVRLNEVLEATSDAIVRLDREFRFTYLNGEASRLIDPERTLLGQSIFDSFPDVREGVAWEAYQQTMHQGVTGEFELFYGGSLNRWFSVQTRPAPDGIVVFFRDISHERQQARELREQADRLTAMQQAARVASWHLDLATGAILWGPGSFEVMGRPFAEVSDLESLKSFLLDGHAESLEAHIARAFATGEPVSMEFAIRAAEGRTIWVEARSQAADGPGSTTLRGFSVDITQRKLDQEVLLASEARYRVLADLNPLAIWMTDRDGRVTYSNQRIVQYLGSPLEELGGRGWMQAFHPDDQVRAARVWDEAFSSGTDYDIEALLRNAATREYRYWHIRAAPVRDASGAILSWLGVAQDVHDAKTTAGEIHAQQEEAERKRMELETIYKTTPVGLALVDPVEFRFLNLNDREAEILGLPKDQVVGRPLSEIAPVPGLIDLFREVAAGRVVRDHLVEGELPSRPGERRAWSVNYSPLVGDDGNVRAISTASIEITDQKKAERALVQSEKLAAVGRLASSISHEINNPLEAITNLLYLINIDETLPSSLKVYVQMAQSEVSRVSQIATQTLRFHRQAVAPTKVTAAELVGAVVQLYTGRLANSNIRVQTRYDLATTILCFENDIRQVLNNLIANAIDAMRAGGRLMVRAHLGRDWASGRQGLRITIADTGHGMGAGVLARIFEPFYTTKDLNGTGLGLWISKGIVERHAGTLRVRSSIDPLRQGSVFTLFLPAIAQSPQQEAS